MHRLKMAVGAVLLSVLVAGTCMAATPDTLAVDMADSFVTLVNSTSSKTCYCAESSYSEADRLYKYIFRVDEDSAADMTEDEESAKAMVNIMARKAETFAATLVSMMEVCFKDTSIEYKIIFTDPSGTEYEYVDGEMAEIEMAVSDEAVTESLEPVTEEMVWAAVADEEAEEAESAVADDEAEEAEPAVADDDVSEKAVEAAAADESAETASLTQEEFLSYFTAAELTTDNWQQFLEIYDETEEEVDAFDEPTGEKTITKRVRVKDNIIPFGEDDIVMRFEISYTSRNGDYNADGTAYGDNTDPHEEDDERDVILWYGDGEIIECYWEDPWDDGEHVYKSQKDITSLECIKIKGTVLLGELPDDVWQKDSDGRYISVVTDEGEYKLYESGAVSEPGGATTERMGSGADADLPVYFLWCEILGEDLFDESQIPVYEG